MALSAFQYNFHPHICSLSKSKLFAFAFTELIITHYLHLSIHLSIKISALSGCLPSIKGRYREFSKAEGKTEKNYQ
jgi:hypothetical protein